MRRYLWIVPLCAALALLGLGLAGGQERQVLMKAAQVCLECIGVG